MGRARDGLPAVVAVAGVVAAWEVASQAAGSPLLPGVDVVAARLADDAALLWEHGRVTAVRGFGGLGVAVVLGVALGLAMARSKLVDAMAGPLLAATYPVPKLALYPLFLLTFGLGTLSKVAVVGLECLYPIAYATYQGARSVDRRLVWTCRSTGAGRLATVRAVLLPGALPSLLAGVRVAVPTMLVVVVVAEMLGESRGLGFLIRFAGANFEPEGALAVVVVLGAVGFVLDRLLAVAGRALTPWEGAGRHRRPSRSGDSIGAGPS